MREQPSLHSRGVVGSGEGSPPSFPLLSLLSPASPEPPPFKVIISPVSFKDLAVSPGRSGAWPSCGMALNDNGLATTSAVLRYLFGLRTLWAERKNVYRQSYSWQTTT